jgi:hypothetical protein
MTPREVGERHGLSRERIRQLQERSGWAAPPRLRPCRRHGRLRGEALPRVSRKRTFRSQRVSLWRLRALEPHVIPSERRAVHHIHFMP